MLKHINIIGITVFLMLGLFSWGFSEETLTITTYYPSPYGSYRELTAHRMKIGTTYSDGGTSVSDNNLIVEGNVGIGTTGPGSKLEVVGGIRATQTSYIPMDCRAIPAEDHESQPTCVASNEWQLAAWCSGDCSSDDARVTICCQK